MQKSVKLGCAALALLLAFGGVGCDKKGEGSSFDSGSTPPEENKYAGKTLTEEEIWTEVMGAIKTACASPEYTIKAITTQGDASSLTEIGYDYTTGEFFTGMTISADGAKEWGRDAGIFDEGTYYFYKGSSESTGMCIKSAPQAGMYREKIRYGEVRFEALVEFWLFEMFGYGSWYKAPSAAAYLEAHASFYKDDQTAQASISTTQTDDTLFLTVQNTGRASELIEVSMYATNSVWEVKNGVLQGVTYTDESGIKTDVSFQSTFDKKVTDAWGWREVIVENPTIMDLLMYGGGVPLATCVYTMGDFQGAFFISASGSEFYPMSSYQEELAFVKSELEEERYGSIIGLYQDEAMTIPFDENVDLTAWGRNRTVYAKMEASDNFAYVNENIQYVIDPTWAWFLPLYGSESKPIPVDPYGIRNPTEMISTLHGDDSHNFKTFSEADKVEVFVNGELVTGETLAVEGGKTYDVLYKVTVTDPTDLMSKA